MRETNETHWLICPHCGGKTKLKIREDTLKDVQEYMGHSDIQMTANIYGHLDVQRKQLLTEKWRQASSDPVRRALEKC